MRTIIGRALLWGALSQAAIGAAVGGLYPWGVVFHFYPDVLHLVSPRVIRDFDDLRGYHHTAGLWPLCRRGDSGGQQCGA